LRWVFAPELAQKRTPSATKWGISNRHFWGIFVTVR
jgi:hypothetical protein